MARVAVADLRLELADSRAFGDGSHPTTRVCLDAVRALAPRGPDPWRMLDFGSGTGILTIAAAKLGAYEAIGIEIDEAALAVSAENAELNGAGNRVGFVRSLDDVDGVFELVVANILCGVLVAFADALVARVAANGTLVLSGLVATDVPAVIAAYSPKLAGRRPEIYERGEWRALAWRGPRVTDDS